MSDISLTSLSSSEVAQWVEGACYICNKTEGRLHRALEMMFGSRQEFAYFECSSCGCLHLIQPPTDIGVYYPSHYYAYASPDSPSVAPKSRIRRWAYDKRNRAQLLGSSGPWGLAARIRPRPDLARTASMLSPIPSKSLKLRILDVGCGSGTLLRLLNSVGFESLTGVDPFLPTDVEISSGCRIFAGDLESLVGRQFDLIMFHHSLEHLPNQLETLRIVQRMLSPQGVCLICIPLAASEPWKKYGTDWVELDAPRHYYLHSPRSLEIVACRADLEVYHTAYESTAFTYWGSELYRRNTPLYNLAERSWVNPHTVFSECEMDEFRKMASQDNYRGAAGRGAFYLRKC